MMFRQSMVAFLVMGLSLITIGCGGSTPGDLSQPVKGKLTKNGTVLKVETPGPGVAWVEVRFYPVDAAGAISELNYQAGVNKDDGSFNVPGPSQQGLPPGKYRVIVRQWDPYPQTDKLGGKFDETNSKITREITGPTTLDIDLAKLDANGN